MANVTGEEELDMDGTILVVTDVNMDHDGVSLDSEPVSILERDSHEFSCDTGDGIHQGVRCWKRLARSSYFDSICCVMVPRKRKNEELILESAAFHDTNRLHGES